MLPTDKFLAISTMTCANLDVLLDKLGVCLNKNNHRYFGTCPIHDGDNFSAFSLYPDGHSVPGYWVCRSRKCHKEFNANIIGFTRGVLSNHKCNWIHSKAKYSFDDTIKFLCKNIICKPYDEIKLDKELVDKYNFIADANIFKRDDVKPTGIGRDIVAKNLKIPSEYYVGRGYSREILSKYDIGLCVNRLKEMYGRVVFPVYDEDYKYVVGCCGRSIHQKCEKCMLFHDGPCPEHSLDRMRASKWYNNRGFSTHYYLFNYWFAKHHIAETSTVVVVEGPGDVLRLEEAGIHNSVGIFGVELTDPQQVILESSGAMSMILLLDNDKAGKIAIENIKRKCGRSYKIYTPDICAKDIGDMSVDTIKSTISPVISEIENNNRRFV